MTDTGRYYCSERCCDEALGRSRREFRFKATGLADRVHLARTEVEDA